MNSKIKIAVIGANGQLGTDLVAELVGYDIHQINHDDVDVTDYKKMSDIIKIISPSYIINTSAYHRTDYCELNPEKAFNVNSIGALNLARISEDNKSTLFHISTDYVFDGSKKKPYIETDPVKPLNIYANSKVSGEFNIMNNSSRFYILRTSGLYGKSICRAKGENFVTKMLRLAKEKDKVKVVSDEILTPTWTASLSRQIRKIIASDNIPFGIIHSTDEGSCSWYDFTEKIFYYTKVNTILIKASTVDFQMNIKRPTYSVLENRVLIESNSNIMNNWEYSLKEYLKLFM